MNKAKLSLPDTGRSGTKSVKESFHLNGTVRLLVTLSPFFLGIRLGYQII